jgi:RNA polymerase sigma-70 factor (ECF subfamily)
VRWSSVFASAWSGTDPRASGPLDPMLDSTLDALLVGAQAAWPQLTLSAGVFIRHLGATLDPLAADAVAALHRLHGADLFLACACLHQIDGGLAAFEAAYLRPLPALLAGALDIAPAEVDEIRQRLRVKLLVADPSSPRPPLIASYSGRGPLGAWVRVAAVRIGLTLARDARIGERVGRRAASEALRAQGTADPELRFLKDRYRRDFAAAFAVALATIADRQRALLRLQFVAGLPLEKIAAIYQVDRSTVSRWLAQARGQLLDRTELDLRERLGVEPAEFESLARLLTSQVEIDLPDLLRTS